MFSSTEKVPKYGKLFFKCAKTSNFSRFIEKKCFCQNGKHPFSFIEVNLFFVSDIKLGTDIMISKKTVDLRP